MAEQAQQYVCFPGMDEEEFSLPAAVTDSLLSPAVVIHMPRVRSNIDKILQIAGANWIPHLKTTKIPEVWQCMLDRQIREFKCTTSRELAVFLNLIHPDTLDARVLVAYPVCGPMLKRVSQLAATAPHVRVSVLVDSLGAVDDVPPNLGIYIDLNPGMDRTGLHYDEVGAWRNTVRAIALRAGAQFVGLHSYEGHLTEAKADECERGYNLLCEAVQLLHSQHTQVTHVITSGSDTFGTALRSVALKQLRAEGMRVSVSPGICVFHDYKSDLLKPTTRSLEAAAVVMARVVSMPAPGRCTLSAGSKSLDCASGEPVCWIAGRSPGWTAMKPSEEHLPVDVSGGPLPVRGEIVWLITRHICCTINLAEKVVLVDGDRVWTTVVAARGHELFLDTKL